MSERTLDYLPLDEVNPAPRNPKMHAMDPLRASIARFGFTAPALIDERTGRLVVGHGRTDALAAMREEGQSPPAGVRVDEAGRWLVPVVRGWSSRSDDEAAAYLIADNQLTVAGGWDEGELAAMLAELVDADPDLADVFGFDDDELAALLGGGDGGGDGPGGEGAPAPSLADRFLIPPFDLLDARSGWWRERKQRWLSVGFTSGAGRDGGLVYNAASSADPQFYDKKTAVEKRLGRKLSTAEFEAEHYERPDTPVASGTSIFDPVLCELVYRWFCPPGGLVLDPFAGGSVRGVVAASLGRRYHGNDLSDEQVDANREQAAALVAAGILDAAVAPVWSAGDSVEWVPTLDPDSADLMFTCPPYYDLERYGDNPADLANMSYGVFDAAYARIIAGAAAALRADRFAVIVVGDVRGKGGHLRDLRGRTIAAAEAAGLGYCSGAVLATPAGSVPIRAARQFSATRTLGRVHQDVLVFVRGDRKRAAQECGPIEVELPEGVGDDDVD